MEMLPRDDEEEQINVEAVNNPLLLRAIADYLYVQHKALQKEDVSDGEKE